jgi:lipooligosaccharide transport system ATP-binding protein
MAAVIEVRNLVKKYVDKPVVQGVSLEIQHGECFGLLGPNGAGKSTMMRILYCVSPMTAGEVFVLGLNVRDQERVIKSRIGIVPQEDGLDPDFTAYDNLYLYSLYHSVPTAKARLKIEKLMEAMKLEEHRDFRVDQLSGGLRRRLTIARALINDPQVLFLDEPTTGLDPNARLWIWDTLAGMKREGRTLVLTTHYMEEAEQLCDRVAIMDNGRILAVGSPQELISEHIGHEVVEFMYDPKEHDYLTKRLEPHYEFQTLNNRMRLFLQSNQNARETLDLFPNKNILIRPASLGDVFLKLAGYDLRD